MRLLHATPARNLAGIQRAGLLTTKSRGRLPAVWLCTPGKATWAALHVVHRHGGQVEGVVLLEVTVPRAWLRRAPRKGLWYCRRDLRPGRIRRIWGFHELAG
jgi:hypothetical protein